MSKCIHSKYDKESPGDYFYDYLCLIEKNVPSYLRRPDDRHETYYYNICYDEDKARKECQIWSYVHGSYIVTAVCETLSEPKYIRISEKFKEKLIESGKYQQQLAIYNVIGPVIANRIRGNERICRILLERTIKPVCNLIEKGKDDEALKQFTDMVVQFIEPEFRTNQENCRPNGVLTELMISDPTTIRKCEQDATTNLLGYRIDELKRPLRLLKTL